MKRLPSPQAVFVTLLFTAYSGIMLSILSEPGKDWFTAVYSVVFVCGILGTLVQRRACQTSGTSLAALLSASTDQAHADTDEIAPAVRDYLIQRMFILKCLVIRGHGELFARAGVLPPDLDHIVRELMNSFLRERGVWGSLEPDELQLMADTQGSWPIESIQRLTAWCEQARVLRWTLRIDDRISSVTQFPRQDLQLMSASFRLQSDTPVPTDILTPWDLRYERDRAKLYTAYLLVEAGVRGQLSEVPEMERCADQLRREHLDVPRDLIAGETTLPEFKSEHLCSLLQSAWERAFYAEYLMDLLRSTTPFCFSSWKERTFRPNRPPAQ